jgi:hypothetical protein
LDDRSPYDRRLPPADETGPASPAPGRARRKSSSPGLSAFKPKNGLVLRDIEALPYDAIAAARRGSGPSLA